MTVTFTTALCENEDPELWFPDPADHETRDKAKAICNECPLRAGCLEFSLETKTEYGVWGGLDEEERQRLMRSRVDRGTQKICAGCNEMFYAVARLQYCSTHCRRRTHYRRTTGKGDRTTSPSPLSSEIRGVSWNPTKGKWVVLIRHGGTTHWVGTFADQQEAEAAAVARLEEFDKPIYREAA